MRIIIQCLLVALLMLPLVSNAQSSDVIRAKHMISQVDKGLSRVKRNDTNTINGYTEKLKQAKEILEAETNKQDPGFREVAGQWMATRDKLYATLEGWKTQNAAAASAPKPKQSVTAEFEQLKTKYQLRNRPSLAQEADLKTSQAWLNKMLNLYGAQWQQDNQQIQQWYSNGQITKKQYDNFQHWVNTTWHKDIGQQLEQAFVNWSVALEHQLTASENWLKLTPDDYNKVMNTAGGPHLPRNKQAIADAKNLVALVSQFEKHFGKEQIKLRKKQISTLTLADQHLDELTPIATKYLEETAKLPPKSNKNPNSMYLWLNGNRFAEITQKREIWINGDFAGSYSKSGEIYAKGNYQGQLMPNGSLYLSRQSRSATIEENGKVWLGGNHVGTIYKDGRVDGAVGNGTIEGPGDWRYAAVVYFLQVFPHK